ncbi:MAG: hypothetical protein ABI035_06430 [Gemmatimonadaceae bacterium]
MSIVKAPTDLSQYAGALPYDAVEFGVYQPLLNWYGYQARRRTSATIQDATASVIRSMADNMGASNAPGNIAGSRMIASASPLALEVPPALQSPVASQIVAAASTLVKKSGRMPTTAEWQSLLTDDKVKTYVDAAGRAQNAPAGTVTTKQRGQAASPYLTPNANPVDAATATFFQSIALHQPDLLNSIFLANQPDWQRAMNFIDPFATAAKTYKSSGDFPGGRRPTGMLSPVGFINLYREYFFELDTFLGPPVGHVWVSPGGSLELYEVTTRSTTTTTTTEISTTQTAKEETDTTDQDELSTAAKTDNKNDTKLGASVDAGGSFLGIVHADAKASFSNESSVDSSNETAHKQSRTQSTKLSKEITQNYKTTFSTTTETTDTSSRRYVLSNTTATLANYELRRKLRLIGVQVQHIGTRLSWQTFVPNPASLLGVGEFVPVPADNSAAAAIQPPVPLDPLKPQETDVMVSFPLMIHPVLTGSPELDHVFVQDWGKVPPPVINGEQDANRETDDSTPGNLVQLPGDTSHADRLLSDFPFAALPPGDGYTATGVRLVTSDKQFWPVFFIEDAAKATIRVRALSVFFDGAMSVNLTLKVTWDPPVVDPREPAYQQALQAYTTNLGAAQSQDYVNATRALLKTASALTPRSSDDLRNEERDAIYRQLYLQLTHLGFADQYLTAEYVRELFDVDNMLYYVEPDYYMPRALGPTPGFPAGSVPPGDMLGGATMSNWPRRPGTDYYLISEDSQPAPSGSSLGWTIQLDGDERRNEFLNAAWVKAVIPMKPGHEVDALAWLENENVEGTDGLNDPYVPQPGDPSSYVGTVGDVLQVMATSLAAQNANIENTLQTETVFEAGFDPLANGIKLDPTIDFKQNAAPYEMFDFWLEVLPTDQIVAVDYDPTKHGA